MPDTSILMPYNGKPPIAERLGLSKITETIATVAGTVTEVDTPPFVTFEITISENAKALIVEGVVERWMLSLNYDVLRTAPGRVAVYRDTAPGGRDFASFTAAAHWVADREGK